MRIAVLSDTHMSDADGWIDTLYARHLEPADAILHCGDFTGAPLLYYLMRHPGFVAVAGNMDRYGVTGDLPARRELTIDGVSIGLTHGDGLPWPLAENLPAAFSPEVQLICFGHTHKFQDTTVGGTRILNPGSVTSPRSGPRSLAMVHTDSGSIVEIEKIVLA